MKFLKMHGFYAWPVNAHQRSDEITLFLDFLMSKWYLSSLRPSNEKHYEVPQIQRGGGGGRSH